MIRLDETLILLGGNMKVYVVESGEYSDRYIDFVTDDEEIAKLYCELHNYSESTHYNEYDTDAVSLEELHSEKDNAVPSWYIEFNPKGELVSSVFYYAERDHKVDSYIGFTNSAYVHVFNIPKKEKEKAIKAARDKRAKLLAEKFGL